MRVAYAVAGTGVVGDLNAVCFFRDEKERVVVVDVEVGVWIESAGEFGDLAEVGVVAMVGN